MNLITALKLSEANASTATASATTMAWRRHFRGFTLLEFIAVPGYPATSAVHSVLRAPATRIAVCSVRRQGLDDGAATLAVGRIALAHQCVERLAHGIEVGEPALDDPQLAVRQLSRRGAGACLF